MCNYRHEHYMVYKQRSEDKLACWLLPFTCLFQGLLFTATCVRIAGPMIFQNFPLSASHLTIEVYELQIPALCRFWESELRSSDLQGLLY